MSLICGEHEGTPAAHYMRLTDGVFCVTTENAERFTAVCSAVLQVIPVEKRSRTPIEGGIDIHIGHSGPTFPGLDDRLNLHGFRLGLRIFSITRETAQRYLPRVTKAY